MFGRNRQPTFYEEELARLKAELANVQPCTDEYDRLMKEICTLREFVGKEKEMNQLLTKEGRGNIAGKVVGFLGLGGLAFGLARFEKNGHFFSGSSGSVISNIVKIGSHFFG